MWISRQLTKGMINQKAEEAEVTLSGTATEATGSLQTRNFTQYAPYGYSCVIPEGLSVLMIPTPNGNVSCGVVAENKTVAAGEIKIQSAQGGYVYLKNDGSVMINGVSIFPDGTIKANDFLRK